MTIALCVFTFATLSWLFIRGATMPDDDVIGKFAEA